MKNPFGHEKETNHQSGVAWRAWSQTVFLSGRKGFLSAYEAWADRSTCHSNDAVGLLIGQVHPSAKHAQRVAPKRCGTAPAGSGEDEDEMAEGRSPGFAVSMQSPKDDEMV